MACSKALGETAVDEHALRSADFLLHERGGVRLAGVDAERRTQLSRELELGVVDVHGDDVEAHGLGELDRHVAEAADTGDHHPVPGPVSETFSPLYTATPAHRIGAISTKETLSGRCPT